MSEVGNIEWRLLKKPYDFIEVNNMGEVRYKNTNIFLCLLNIGGYRLLDLPRITRKGASKRIQAHRLVAKAFIPNPDNKPFVNHINGVRHDNRVENLEWCTQRENVQHAFRTGLIKFKKGVDHHLSKRVVNIKTGEDFGNLLIASKRLGLHRNTLARYLNGKKKNKTDLKYYSENHTSC